MNSQLASRITMNIIPTIYIVYLLFHEVQSKVEFFGVMEEFHNIVKVTLNCYFSTGSHDCSAEFLHNKETIDNLRASNDKCYHKKRLCRADTCVCSNDCKRYNLILTNMYYTAGDIFGCEVHYMDEGYILSMTTELLFNGSDFLYHKTYSSIVAQPDKDSSSTKPPDTKKPMTIDEIFIGLLIVLVTIIVGGFSILCLAIKRQQKAALRRRNNSNQMQAIAGADDSSGTPHVQLRTKRYQTIFDESHDDQRNSGDPLDENRESKGSAMTESTTVDRLSVVTIPGVDLTIDIEDTAL